MPAALRGQRPAWRDPRLWIGIVLVAASVVVGARVLAAADDTVQVWAAARDLGAGQRVEADDLVAQRVRFADADALEGYFTVDDELPADLELTRSVAGGELLPRGAVGTPDETGLVEVPVAVEPELVPPSVAPGDVVDVYVVAPISADADREGPGAATGWPRARRCDRRRRPRAGVVVRHQRQAPARPRRARGGRAGVLRPPGPLRRPEPHRGPTRMKVVLLLAAGAAWETRALAMLSGRRDLVVLKRCVDVDDLLATATSGQADTAVVAIEAPGFDLAAVDHLVKHGVRAVAVVGDELGTVRASRIGVRATVPGDDLEALPETITTDHQPAPEPPPTPDDPPPSQGRVIAVWGPAGAPGRTTVATTLAAVLGSRARTTLVDADPYGGTVAQALGVLDEVSGLLSAARLAGSGMLEERFASVQRAFDQQFTVVTGLPRPDRWTEVRPGTVELLAEIASRHGHVVIDTGFGLDDDDLSGRPAATSSPWPPSRSPTRCWSSAPPTRSACRGWSGRWSTSASGAP